MLGSPDAQRKYRLYRSYWDVAMVATIFLAFAIIILATEDFDQDILVFWFGFWALTAIAGEIIYRRTNFVIVHSDRIDISRRNWGPRTKRRKWRIPFEDIASIHVDEGKAEIFLSFANPSRLMRRFGIVESSASAKLVSATEARELTDRIIAAKELQKQLFGLYPVSNKHEDGPQSDPP